MAIHEKLSIDLPELQRALNCTPRFVRTRHRTREPIRPFTRCRHVRIGPVENLLNGEVGQSHVVSDAAMLGQQFGERRTA